MTLNEAKKVAIAASEADGGNCLSCTLDVVVVLNTQFPEFEWKAIMRNEAEVDVEVRK